MIEEVVFLLLNLLNEPGGIFSKNHYHKNVDLSKFLFLNNNLLKCVFARDVGTRKKSSSLSLRIDILEVLFSPLVAIRNMNIKTVFRILHQLTKLSSI